MAEIVNDKYVLSVQKTAELLGTNPQTIRDAIDNDAFPFGCVIKKRSGRPVYKISKIKLLEFLGITEESL